MFDPCATAMAGSPSLAGGEKKHWWLTNRKVPSFLISFQFLSSCLLWKSCFGDFEMSLLNIICADCGEICEGRKDSDFDSRTERDSFRYKPSGHCPSSVSSLRISPGVKGSIFALSPAIQGRRRYATGLHSQCEDGIR